MPMKLTAAVGALCALLALAAPAVAAQLQPVMPVAAKLYTGRWYEIARTPNHMQSDCQGATTDFGHWSGGAFSAVQTCHAGAPSGPAHKTNVQGHVVPDSQNARMQINALGGLIKKQYVILDHSDDNRWLIMCTSAGDYVWLMSRQPILDPSTRYAALSRLKSLGFDLTRISMVPPAIH